MTMVDSIKSKRANDTVFQFFISNTDFSTYVNYEQLKEIEQQKSFNYEVAITMMQKNKIDTVINVLRAYYQKLNLIGKFRDYLQKMIMPKNVQERENKKKVLTYLQQKIKKIFRFDQKLLIQTQQKKNEALKKIFHQGTNQQESLKDEDVEDKSKKSIQLNRFLKCTRQDNELIKTHLEVLVSQRSSLSRRMVKQRNLRKLSNNSVEIHHDHNSNFKVLLKLKEEQRKIMKEKGK